MLEYNGCLVTQAENNHITIRKGGRLIFHAIYDKKLTDEQLRKYADDVFEFLEEVGGYKFEDRG